MKTNYHEKNSKENNDKFDKGSFARRGGNEYFKDDRFSKVAHSRKRAKK